MGLILDQVSLSEVPADQAYERVLLDDGSYGTEWIITAEPTPGFVNNDDGYALFQQNNAIALGPVVINEVMTSNAQYVEEQDGGFYDWIELYNRSSEAVDISVTG